MTGRGEPLYDADPETECTPLLLDELRELREERGDGLELFDNRIHFLSRVDCTLQVYELEIARLVARAAAATRNEQLLRARLSPVPLDEVFASLLTAPIAAAPCDSRLG